MHVDVASRRDQVHNKLSRTYIDRSRREEEERARTPSSPSSTRSPTSSPNRRNSSSPLQRRDAAYKDAYFAYTENASPGADRDLSPVIEQAISPKTLGESPTLGGPSFIPVPQGTKTSLLRQVMDLRDDSSSKASTIKIPEDLLSEMGDGETVQLFLGETPKLPSENFAPPQPLPNPVSEEQEFHFADGRSSIYPDDSVSVVYSRRSEFKSERLPPIPQTLDTQQAASYTVDSAARSQINRVLEQYQNGSVNTEQAHQVQDQVKQLTPNLAQYNDWDNVERTKQYLQDVLEEDAVQQQSMQTPTTDRSTSRPPSIMDDLMDDDEYRGTAIIYTDKK